jgi:hypothetical protein
MMPRIKECPETEEPCDDGRCTITRCYMKLIATQHRAEGSRRQQPDLLQPDLSTKLLQPDLLTKLRRRAAWRVGVKAVNAHNLAVYRKQEPVFAKVGKKYFPLPHADKWKGVTREQAQQQREAIIDRFLQLPRYADQIEVELKAILAERGLVLEFSN